MPISSDKRDVAEIFRERMALLIDKRGETLSSFAKAIEIDRSALSQFMAKDSTRLPRAETLHAISNTCGVSLDWLLGLVSSELDPFENAPTLEVKATQGDIEQEQSLLNKWHKDALGYKIRYVPATLPDLLRTYEISELEFNHYSSDELSAKEEASRYQLNYSRRPETDMEVCMPIQRLQALAAGRGVWEEIPARIRRNQLETMIELTEEMYPTFRLFLYDERRVFSSAYTVFGPTRAAMYLGNMYLVLNSVEHVKSLTRHFDNLIRNASIGPDRIKDFIEKTLKTSHR